MFDMFLFKFYLRKLPVLFCTGLPGLVRVLVFLLIERMYSVNELGDFASDMSLVQLISFFTAVGWSGLVMTKVAKTEDKERYLYGIINTSIIYYSMFMFALILLSYLGIIKSPLGAAVFLLAWMLYQISRHYRIMLREYKKVIKLDIFNFIMFLIFLAGGTEPLISLASSYFITWLLLSPSINHYKLEFIGCSFQIKAMQIGFSNFLLGLGIYSLPLVLAVIVGPSYAGLAGLCVSFLTLIYLVPRAIGMHYLPIISRQAFTDRNSAYQAYTNQFYYNLLSLLVLTTCSVMFLFFIYSAELTPLLDVEGSIFIVMLILINIVVTALTLPASDFLLAIEKTKSNLKGSLIYATIISLVIIIFLVFGDNWLDVIALLSMFILAGVSRSLFLYREVSRARSCDL